MKSMTIGQAGDTIKIMYDDICRHGGYITNYELISLCGAIGRYKYLGGQHNYIQYLRKYGIVEKVGDANAQEKFMGTAINLTIASEIYIAFSEAAKTLKLKDKCLDEIAINLKAKLKKTLYRYDLDIRAVNKDSSLLVLREGQMIFSLVTLDTRSNTCIINLGNRIIESLTGIKIDGTNKQMLDGLMDEE